MLMIAPTVLSLFAGLIFHVYHRKHHGQKPEFAIWRNLLFQMTVAWFIAYLGYTATGNIWSLFIIIPAIHITQAIANVRFRALRNAEKELSE